MVTFTVHEGPVQLALLFLLVAYEYDALPCVRNSSHGPRLCEDGLCAAPRRAILRLWTSLFPLPAKTPAPDTPQPWHDVEAAAAPEPAPATETIVPGSGDAPPQSEQEAAIAPSPEPETKRFRVCLAPLRGLRSKLQLL